MVNFEKFGFELIRDGSGFRLYHRPLGDAVIQVQHLNDNQILIGKYEHGDIEGNYKALFDGYVADEFFFMLVLQSVCPSYTWDKYVHFAADSLVAKFPYPEDIFAPPTEEEVSDAAKAISRNGLSPDRIFAAWGRRVLRSMAEDLLLN